MEQRYEGLKKEAIEEKIADLHCKNYESPMNGLETGIGIVISGYALYDVFPRLAIVPGLFLAVHGAYSLYRSAQISEIGTEIQNYLFPEEKPQEDSNQPK